MKSANNVEKENKTGKKIIIICGHYGVGKTNVAINIALDYANKGKKVAVCDIDVVNPYFKTADAKDLFEEKSIRLVMPNFANTNLDIPSLPPQIKSLFVSKEDIIIFDVGGDDAGATVLSVYKDDILKFDYEMLYVISSFRPMIKEPKEAFEMLMEIQNSSGLLATGIINNSSLGNKTITSDIENSIPYANEVAKLCNIDIKMNTVMDFVEPKPKVDNMRIISNYSKAIF